MRRENPLFALPNTEDAYEYFAKEQSRMIGKDVMLTTSSVSNRFLFLEKNQIVGMACVVLKNEKAEIHDNILTNLQVQPGHEGKGIEEKLLKEVSQKFNRNLEISPLLKDDVKKIQEGRMQTRLEKNQELKLEMQK
ncbi:hypothetical protein [Aquitalea pelogenes]|uniref:hypothetical protein n=1 Tax=Aquitalea pelogenes TaxID=1293573 RepID=UPI0035AE8B1F